MNLPPLGNPQGYRGLYVFDFGAWSAVGYTAEEIALLLESEQYRSGKVYRIHQAYPDGRMELQGVSHSRFQFESGLFFVRRDLADAQRDFADLIAAGEAGAPCRAAVYLATRPADTIDESAAHVTAMIYPAEYDADVAAWLTAVGYAGGDLVEGGISHVTDFQTADKDILRRAQLWPCERLSRSREEVYASVRRAIQR